MADIHGIVIKSEGNEPPPPGALRMTRPEVQRMQWNLVTSWTPSSEVWPLKFGHIVCSGVSAISGYFICNYYRSKLRLGAFGFLSNQIPCSLVPSTILGYIHHKFVVNPILLQNECPVCIQVRSAALQVAFSMVFPSVLSPVATFVYALRYGTYQFPALTRQNRNLFIQMYWKMTKRFSGPFTGLLVLNTLAATYMTYKEGTTFYKMQMKIIKDRLEKEEKINKHLASAGMS